MIRLLARSAAVLSAAFSAAVAIAQPNFTILDDCQMMMRMHRLAASDAGALVCRPPQDDLEQALEAPYVSAQICLLNDHSGLPGDLCFRTDGGKARTLACIENQDVDVAAQIEAGYDQFGGIISAYLGRANRCPGAKGDAASVSIQVPFGPGLGQVAKLHDVAFAEKFGAGEAVPDFVEEGYATLAPELRRPGRRYVHFVLIGWNWDASRTPGSVVDSDDEPDRALSRAWTVTSETSETDEGMAAFLRQLASSSPYPTIGFAVTLDVKRSSKLDPASTARRALMDRWSSDLVKLYSTAGFTILSDDDLRRFTGMGMTDYRERMLRSTPYSQRESVKETFGPGSFLARSEASCQAPDGTQRIALVLSTYGHASDPEDYGSLVLVSAVVSTCASDAQRVGASQRRAARDAAAIIRREIEGTR